MKSTVERLTFTPAELGKALGYSKQTILNMVQRRDLPDPPRIGNHLHFPIWWVEHWKVHGEWPQSAKFRPADTL